MSYSCRQTQLLEVMVWLKAANTRSSGVGDATLIAESCDMSLGGWFLLTLAFRQIITGRGVIVCRGSALLSRMTSRSPLGDGCWSDYVAESVCVCLCVCVCRSVSVSKSVCASKVSNHVRMYVCGPACIDLLLHHLWNLWYLLVFIGTHWFVLVLISPYATYLLVQFNRKT